MGASDSDQLPPSFIVDPDTALETWEKVWREGQDLQVASHRPVIGTLVVGFKRLLRAIVGPPLASKFDLQNSFNSVMIHNLKRIETEAITRIQDANEDREKRLREQTDQLLKRGDSLFVVLDKRIETLDQQIDGFADEQQRVLGEKLDDLETRYTQTLDRLQELSRRLGELRQQKFMLNRKFDRMLSQSAESGDKGVAAHTRVGDSDSVDDIRERLDDHAYFLFENVFRGSEAVIRARQEIYLPFFREKTAVLDVGCGRGEFLELMQEEGVAASGIDLNEDMIHVCREKGLNADEAEAMTHLRSLEDESLGGVFMAQFIEHLHADTIVEMSKLIWDKLQPGAYVIMETQNPLSMVVSARNFYTDLSHIRPIHPEAARFLLQMVGFREVDVKMLSPFTPDEQLVPILGASSDPPSRDGHLFDKVNRNFQKLNELLFGYQDYAVIGRK